MLDLPLTSKVSFMWTKYVSGPTARLSYIGFVAPRNLNHLLLIVWGKSKNLPRWQIGSTVPHQTIPSTYLPEVSRPSKLNPRKSGNTEVLNGYLKNCNGLRGPQRKDRFSKLSAFSLQRQLPQHGPLSRTLHKDQVVLHQLISVSNFSTISKLLSVTAYVLRFVQQLKKQSKKTGALTTPELDDARNESIKYCQQVTYHKEISDMLSKSSPRTALVRQLRLFLDDTGLICCGGKMHNASVSESTKFPCLLPPKDPFTKLVIRDTHIRQLHAGVNSTLTALGLGTGFPVDSCRTSTFQKSKRLAIVSLVRRFQDYHLTSQIHPHFQNQDYNKQSHLQSQALASQEHYIFGKL